MAPNPGTLSLREPQPELQSVSIRASPHPHRQVTSQGHWILTVATLVTTACRDSICTSHEKLKLVHSLSYKATALLSLLTNSRRQNRALLRVKGYPSLLIAYLVLGTLLIRTKVGAKLPETEGLFSVLQYSGLPVSKWGCLMRTKQVATILYRLSLDVCSQQLQTSPFTIL